MAAAASVTLMVIGLPSGTNVVSMWTAAPCLDFDTSSSRMVSVTSSGSVTPRPFDAVAETVTVASGASVSLSTAVSVTGALLAVCRAGIVRGPLTVKASGTGAIVTVVGSAEGLERLAVTVVLCSSAPDVSGSSDSRIESSARTSVTVGVASSLVIVPVAVGSAGRATAPAGLTLSRVTVNVSSGSWMLSSSVATVKVCSVSPTANVRVPLLAVKSVCAAVSLAATEVA